MKTKEEKAEYQKVYDEVYHKRPEVIAAAKARLAIPEVAAKRKAASKVRHAKPEVRAAQKAIMKAWVASDEGKAWHLKDRCARIGITVEELNLQPKKCSLRGCNATEPGGSGGWQMDHDHSIKTGRSFQGLLCMRHNSGLGYFKDNARLLMAAADYIVEHGGIGENTLYGSYREWCEI
jgi:Recombination endonuclease VII